MGAKRSPAAPGAPDLHERARQRLQAGAGSVGTDWPRDEAGLREELEVHQAELTLQNEALQATQEALATSRDRYRALFEQAPVGYLLLDRRGRIQEANRRAEGLLGTDRVYLEGADLATFIAAESQDAWFLLRRALARDGGRGCAELRLRPADGTAERVVQLEAALEAGPEPAPGLFWCTLTDITERRRAEQALEAEHDRLEARVIERTQALETAWRSREHLLKALGANLFGLDRAGRIAFVSPPALELLGYAAADSLLGRPVSALLEPVAGDDAEPLRAIAITGIALMDHETRFVGADGRPRPVTVYAVPALDDAGAPEVVVAFFDRRLCQARKAAAQREGAALRQALLDSALVQWRWELAEDRIQVAPEAGPLFGIDPEAFQPAFEECLAWVHPDDRAELRAAVQRVLDGEVTALAGPAAGLRLRCGDGAARRVRLQGAPVWDAAGTPVRLVGVAQEVTGRGAGAAAGAPRRPVDTNRLTPREHDVLHQLAQGRTNKEVAAQLGLSPRTVEEHRAHILAKLGVRSFAEFVPLPEG